MLQQIGIPVDGCDLSRAGLEMAESGLTDLKLDRLIALKESGVNTAQIREIHALRFGPFSTQQAIELRRHGVTAESMREAQKWGFTKLSSEQIVKLKRAGVI